MGVGGEHLPQVRLQYLLCLQDFLICFGVRFFSSEHQSGFSGGPKSTHGEGPGEGSGEGSEEGWHVQVGVGPKTSHWHVRPLEGKRLDPQAPRNFGLQILPR